MGSKAKELGFESRQGQEIFLFSAVFTPALGPTRPPIKWVPRPDSSGVKRQKLEADDQPPSSTEVKNGGAILSLPMRFHGVILN
jgi:hypothetical protein